MNTSAMIYNPALAFMFYFCRDDVQEVSLQLFGHSEAVVCLVFFFNWIAFY